MNAIEVPLFVVAKYIRFYCDYDHQFTLLPSISTQYERRDTEVRLIQNGY